MATVGAAQPPADHIRIFREFTGFLSKNSDQFADTFGPKQPEQQQQQDQHVTKQIMDDAIDSVKLLINTSNDGLQRTILTMQNTILDTLRDEIAELRSDVVVGVDNCRAITLNGQAQSGQALQALKTTSAVGGVPVGVIPPAWTALGDTVTVESLASLAKEDPETIRTILAAYGLSLGGGAPARLTRLKKFLGTF